MKPTLDLTYKGRVQKNKMEIFNGICHDRGKGVSVPVTFFHFFLLQNHLQSLPPAAKTDFAHSLGFKLCIKSS